MPKRFSARRRRHNPTARPLLDDGTDPRQHGASGFSLARRGRKTMQLCRRIAETLEQVLAEQEDEVLQGLHVVSVVPAPDESSVLVTVSPGPGLSIVETASLMRRLHDATANLRTEVAAAITRRKVPGLAWRVLG